MPPKRPDPSEAGGAPVDPAELAAAEWLVREDRGLDAAGRREFGRWLRADPRHARTLALLRETWSRLDRVPADRLPVPPRRGVPGPWLAATFAAAAALALVFWSVGRGPAQYAATPIGGFERLTLPDRSVVQLNTGSEIAVGFTAGERRVVLRRGEATFDVAIEAARPFVVEAGGVEVRAVGTAFNVRHQDRAVEVLVTEGRVQLGRPAALPGSAGAGAAALPVLDAGQRATIERPRDGEPVRTAVAAVAPAEVARALAWHRRELEFSAETLANIAAEFNRYNPHRLVIADAALAERRFGGKFPAGDFETLVRLLESSYGVVAERGTGKTVLRLAPAER